MNSFVETFNLMDQLRRYEPIDVQDAAQLERIIWFIQENEDCFKRSHLSGHITGSAWLVDSRGEHVLLTHHKKMGKWLQLGGHADGNVDVLSVALREAQEESGFTDIHPVSSQIFDVDIHSIPERPEEPAHHHYDIRFAMITQQKNFVVSPESNELAWVSIDKIQELTDEKSLLRMAKKWNTLKGTLKT